MGKNGHGLVDWPLAGPRVLDWMRAELPRRQTMVGLYPDCCAALPDLGLGVDRLRNWLARNVPEWPAIKRTLGTGVDPAFVRKGNGQRAARVSEKLAPARLPTRTLAEFLRDKRKVGCPVCALPPEILRCLADASAKGSAKVPEQVEWLNTDCGARVTVAELTSHRSGRHET